MSMNQKMRETVWAVFQPVWGKPDLSDGASEAGKMRQWELTVGQYSKEDILEACKNYITEAKYPKWPEPSKVAEIIRQRGGVPESHASATADSPAVAKAKEQMSYVLKPLRQNPTWETCERYLGAEAAKDSRIGSWHISEALNRAADVANPENRSLSFTACLVKAWLRGSFEERFKQELIKMDKEEKERRVSKQDNQPWPPLRRGQFQRDLSAIAERSSGR